jgi:sugar/nucleoside kinase (ribokinase family)
VVYAALDYAKAQGVSVSYDPNYRPLLWKSEAEAKIEMAKPLALTDILKVSEEEMILLTEEISLEKGALLLAEKGPGIVLVSLGAKGAFCLCDDGFTILPTYNVKTIDTTGAGYADRRTLSPHKPRPGPRGTVPGIYPVHLAYGERKIRRRGTDLQPGDGRRR